MVVSSLAGHGALVLTLHDACRTTQGLTSAIGSELCCCPFSKTLVDGTSQPVLVEKLDIKSAGLFRWSYWSTGLIIGMLFLACSLTEVFFGWENPPATSNLPVPEGLVSALPYC